MKLAYNYGRYCFNCVFFQVAWRNLIVSLGVCLFMVFPASLLAVEFPQIAQQSTDSGPGNITPAKVYQHVTRAQRELDLIRKEMGIGKSSASNIVVRNAAPREVFYQALTLFRKANRFSFEQIRAESTEPASPTGTIYPRHVYAVVDAAMSLILDVKSSLGIHEKIEEPVFYSQLTPSDVFLNIVNLNRQLNQMLEESFAPKDVFQRVSLAIGYSAKLLAEFPDATRIPKGEKLKRGQIPSEVFHRLVFCYGLVRDIGTDSGLEMLEMDISEAGDIVIAPSEVYDIASLLVSELAYLHAQLNHPIAPREIHNPGRKFPSHVYQRVGILQSQLQALRNRVTDSPNWLL